MKGIKKLIKNIAEFSFFGGLWSCTLSLNTMRNAYFVEAQFIRNTTSTRNRALNIKTLSKNSAQHKIYASQFLICGVYADCTTHNHVTGNE